LIGLARDGSRREFGPYEATMGSGSSAFALDRIVPNPLLIRDAAGATIRFRIPTPGGKVRLGLFDVAGRHLRDLVDGPLDPGAHSLAWDTRDAGGVRLPSGCYFFRLQAGYHLAERRFLLLR